MSESPANSPPTRIVGTPQIRKEGVDKVLGRAKYTDDLPCEGARALLERALQESGYANKRKRFAAENPRSAIQRGLGLAAFYHGAGFAGSGERYLNSLAGIDVPANNKVRVLAANTEFGQGTNTILTQVAAESLTLSYDDVDTSRLSSNDNFLC